MEYTYDVTWGRNRRFLNCAHRMVGGGCPPSPRWKESGGVDKRKGRTNLLHVMLERGSTVVSYHQFIE